MRLTNAAIASIPSRLFLGFVLGAGLLLASLSAQIRSGIPSVHADSCSLNLVRDPASGAVYLTWNHMKHHIPNPTTFDALGLRWECVQNDSIYLYYPTGAELPSLRTGSLIRNRDSGATYVLDHGLHWIPDVDTFAARGYNWNDVFNLEAAVFQFLGRGADIPSIHNSGSQTDTQLLQAARQAAQGKAQPEWYGSCLVYAQARGIGVVAGGNSGAFNLLYYGNDARLNAYGRPTALPKPLRSLAGVSDLTSVLRPGDFIVWDRSAGGASSAYGHVAVVELVQRDRLVISQSNWPPAWKVIHTGNFATGMFAYPKGTK